MPVLKAKTISDAKFGSTDLSAVYKGSTQVWPSIVDDYPTPEGHMIAGPINMSAEYMTQTNPLGGTTYTYRVWLYVPYQWRKGEDKPPTNRPSGFSYHPSFSIATFPDGTQQQGWFTAPGPSPISTVTVDGLDYVRMCIPNEGQSGFTWNDPTKPFKLKVCVPFYDGTTPYPPTSDMYSREQGLMIYNETYAKSPAYMSDKLPNPNLGDTLRRS